MAPAKGMMDVLVRAVERGMIIALTIGTVEPHTRVVRIILMIQEQDTVKSQVKKKDTTLKVTGTQENQVKVTLIRNHPLPLMAQAKDIVDVPIRVVKDIQDLVVLMAQAKDIVDVPIRVVKDIQDLVVLMAQAKDIVDVPIRVEKDIQDLVVLMAQAKDIVDVPIRVQKATV